MKVEPNLKKKKKKKKKKEKRKMDLVPLLN